MKITKFIDFSQEIEIDITAEDISAVYGETQDLKAWMYEFNSVVQFFRGTPGVLIEGLNTAQKEVIGRFLAGQSERFDKRICFHDHSEQKSHTTG